MVTARANRLTPRPDPRGERSGHRRPRTLRKPGAPRPRGPARGGVRWALLAFAALGAVGLFHTWLRVEGTREAYALNAAQSRHQRLVREREKLELEVSTLKSPGRIESLARTTLGMTPPREVVVLREAPLPPAAGPAREVSPAPRSLLGVLQEVKGAP